MTTPQERTRAVQRLELAVLRLQRYASGKAPTVRIPRDELRELAHWLRHYPTAFDLGQAHRALPGLWGRPVEFGTMAELVAADLAMANESLSSGGWLVTGDGSNGGK